MVQNTSLQSARNGGTGEGTSTGFTLRFPHLPASKPDEISPEREGQESDKTRAGCCLCVCLHGGGVGVGGVVV